MKYLLSILIIFSVTIFADGTMNFNCEVKDQIVIEIEEGNAKRFTGYRDGLKIGDRFKVDLFWHTEVSLYLFQVRLASNANTLHSTFVDLESIASSSNKNDYYGYHSKPTQFDFLFNNRLHVNNSLIEITQMDFDYIFNRYYKNDWDLMYKSYDFMLVADCKASGGYVEDLIKDLEFKKNK